MPHFQPFLHLTDNISLADGFKIQGGAVQDYAGFNMSWGDINGDGYDDMLITADGVDGGGDRAGAAYVIYGKATGFGFIDLAHLTPDIGFMIQGEHPYDLAGRDVASAGDINGDGFDDIIMGAFLDDSAGYNSGEAYVIFGKASGWDPVLDLKHLTPDEGFKIQGEHAGDYAGLWVQSAGDINGDGYADMIMGAPLNGTTDPRAGAAYVIFGKATGFTDLDLAHLDPADGFKITGAHAGDYAGFSVAGAGDINGDGFADMVIGAIKDDTAATDAGAAYVIFGKASGFGSEIDLDTLAPADGFRIQGEGATDWAGLNVSSAGDFNGDGFADIVIGAIHNDGGGADAGAAYVIFGKASGFGNLDLAHLDPADGFKIQGENANSETGVCVALAGDVNGDGFADILVGARSNSGSNGVYGTDTGAVYLIFGKASGFEPVLDLAHLSPADGIKFFGESALDYTGQAVSGAGDINGDGFDDIQIGAPRNGTAGFRAGADFIIFGRPDNVAPDGTDATLSVGEDGTRVLAAADFGFTDSDGDSLLAVTITTLPDHGILYYDADGPGGNDPVAVTAGQSISATDLADGKLSFAPAADANGAGYASFTFQVQDNGGVVARGVDLDPSPNTITFDVTPVNDAPTSTGLAGDVASFTEGGAAVALDVGGNATIADIDSADFDTGTLTVAVTGNAVPGEDVLSVADQGNGAGQIGVSGNAVSFGGVQFATFTGGSAGNPLVFTFDADATPAAVQALVRDIFYANSNDTNPATAERTISWTLVDGDGTAHGGADTLSLTSRVDVVGVNDAPAGTDTALTLAEDGSRAFSAADFGFSDADGGSLLAVKITTLPDHGTLLLNGSAVSAGELVPVAEIDAGHLTFNPAPDANGAAYASFTFQVEDDGGTANGGLDLDPSPNTITFDVTPVNDAPTSTGLAGDVASFTEGGAAVALDVGGNATIADIDSADFDTGTLIVAVTGNAVPGEDVLSVANQGNGAGQIGVSGSAVSFGGVQFATFTGGSAGNPLVFTFDADATPAAVQALVRDIFYANSNDTNPATAERTISWTLVDGDGTAHGGADTLNLTTKVDVIAVNDAPVVDLNGAGAGVNNSVGYTENAAPTLLAPNATVVDVDSPDFDGGHLAVAIGPGFQPSDFLTIIGQGSGAGQIGLSGNVVTYGGVSIGTVSGGGVFGAPTGTMVISFSGSAATPEAVQALIHQIAYYADSEDPSTTQRAILFSLTDGDGGTSGNPNAFVNVTAVDDPPVAQPDAVATNEATILTGSVFSDNGSGLDSDVDGPALTVSAVNGSATAVGHQLALASGALLTLNTDGSFAYDPNHAFDATPAAGSGASNTPAHDSFTYTLMGGNTTTVAVTIAGLDSNDLLLGTAGPDVLAGGQGDDAYLIDQPGDVVSELAGGGHDTVYTLVSYALAAGSEVETLTAYDRATTNAMNLTGNEFDNFIYGNAGVNALIGGGGTDTMYGLGGDDAYLVDSAGDQAIEFAGQGNDTVYTTVSYTLTAGSEIETLTPYDRTSTAALTLTGNEFDNVIYGNAGANGLIGGAGADTMYGLGGDDSYVVDNAGDRVIEAVGQGHDTVYALTSYALTPGSEIETLTVYDRSTNNAIDLTGNEYDNVIYGNNGANSLIGGGGADTMYGFGGDDSYFVDSASDQVIELAGQGNDTVYTNVSYALAASANVETLTVYDRTSTNAIDLTGSDSANVIYGNAGDNVIYGRAGNDVFYGLGGADTFRLVNANNISHDTVMDFTAGVDRIELDHTNFFGLAVGTLPDSAFVIGSSAQDADDRIIYDINNGNLYFDPDGKGFNNQVLIAHFDNHAVLTASDFHVI